MNLDRDLKVADEPYIQTESRSCGPHASLLPRSVGVDSCADVSQVSELSTFPFPPLCRRGVVTIRTDDDHNQHDEHDRQSGADRTGNDGGIAVLWTQQCRTLNRWDFPPFSQYEFNCRLLHVCCALPLAVLTMMDLSKDSEMTSDASTYVFSYAVGLFACGITDRSILDKSCGLPVDAFSTSSFA